MMDPIFRLRCVDCDARGLLSRLWLRSSIELGSGSDEVRHPFQRPGPYALRHYVECMNCGAHLKNGRRDGMEIVDDAEWRRCVDDALEPGPASPTGVRRID